MQISHGTERRTRTDGFKQILPRLKCSNMVKLPVICQRRSTVHTASGYGTNIMKWKTKKKPKRRLRTKTKSETDSIENQYVPITSMKTKIPN